MEENAVILMLTGSPFKAILRIDEDGNCIGFDDNSDIEDSLFIGVLNKCIGYSITSILLTFEVMLPLLTEAWVQKYPDKIGKVPDISLN